MSIGTQRLNRVPTLTMMRVDELCVAVERLDARVRANNPMVPTALFSPNVAPPGTASLDSLDSLRRHIGQPFGRLFVMFRMVRIGGGIKSVERSRHLGGG